MKLTAPHSTEICGTFHATMPNAPRSFENSGADSRLPPWPHSPKPHPYTMFQVRRVELQYR